MNAYRFAVAYVGFLGIVILAGVGVLASDLGKPRRAPVVRHWMR